MILFQEKYLGRKQRLKKIEEWLEEEKDNYKKFKPAYSEGYVPEQQITVRDL